MEKIKVKNSGYVALQSFNDHPDGSLFIGEALKHIPTKIKRFYFINNLTNKKAVRGKHAHKKNRQWIFCVNGKFTLDLDDGKIKQSFTLDKPQYGIELGPRLWHSMRNFSKDCVILVISDSYYDEKDYIRDYKRFTEYIKRK
ncbi:MAG: FdtA/QdtA family cupin domain-containing protein [Parcubacteria group bacterium]|nr:FdtA/QdtA family cupin domain-containing protein [Parcubacteria group bacterium]